MKKSNINPVLLEIDGFDYEKGIKYSILPATVDGKKYFVVNEKNLVDAMNFYSKLGTDLDLIITDEDSFSRLLSQALEIQTKEDLTSPVEEEDVSLEEFVKNSFDILDSESSAPIIKFVNSMFYQAIKKNASDIHIETHENFGLLRFRIDGVLIPQARIDKKAVELIINRLKVISNLDISEKRVPQDGRTQIKINNKQIDIRVSIVPVYYGEKAVMRILMESSNIPSPNNLGFSDYIITTFKSIIERSYGMILVSGPTGSGKSTTLHSFLQLIASSEKNIVTIEDPVEYKADNINQIQVNPKVNLTFANALRSILRQDPDIIMVGEIRDKETAQIAIQSALTGHLMLSTIHSNTSTAAITRLVDMGIAPYLISSAIAGVLSQRLVRVLCNKCKKESYKIVEGKEVRVFEANGCEECNFLGYKGRIAIGELLVINNEVKALISKGADDFTLRKYMIDNGIKTLKEIIFGLLVEGKISYNEAIRVGLKDE